MKFMAPLIAVKDVEVSKAFYEKVLGQSVKLDLGWNVTMSGGFALQMHYDRLVDVGDFDIKYNNNDHELYFEEDDFERFEAHMQQFDDIAYVHKAKEYPWGQRVTRFYDPDGHIIEVGESMESVFRRFHSEGLSIEAVAEKTMHPVEFVKKYIG